MHTDAKQPQGYMPAVAYAFTLNMIVGAGEIIFSQKVSLTSSLHRGAWSAVCLLQWWSAAEFCAVDGADWFGSHHHAVPCRGVSQSRIMGCCTGVRTKGKKV